MDLRAGDIDIVGTKENALRVTCRVDRAEDGPAIQIRFNAGTLRIYGGGTKGVHYRVEVPEKTGLIVKSPAGDLRVKGITGDKDVELKAGNLTIDVGAASQYKVADARVMVGDLKAKPFGVQKDGLNQSFRKENAGGQYRLHAEVAAGDLTLQ